MKRLSLLAVVAAGVLGGASGAAAQSAIPLALEVRGGAAVPTGDLKSALNAETGVSYGITATLNAIPMIGIYAGYERSDFSVDNDAMADADLTDQGFAFGGKLTLPLGLTGLGPWVRGGAVYNKLSRDAAATVDDFDDERKWGFEVGGGLAIPLGTVVSVTPGVRYRTHTTGPVVGGESVNASYVVADLGLSFTF